MATGITLKKRFCKGCETELGTAPAQKWCSKECRKTHHIIKYRSDFCLLCGAAPRWKENQSYCIACFRLKRYRLSPDDLNFLKMMQGNRCRICEKILTSFHIDHDHNCCPTSVYTCGKCVRGLLCQKCNNALGMFNDDITILEKAIRYIKGTI